MIVAWPCIHIQTKSYSKFDFFLSNQAKYLSRLEGRYYRKNFNSRNMGIFSSYWQIIVVEKLSLLKNVHRNSSDKLNWKHCFKDKWENIWYLRWIWNRPWNQRTKLRGNTCRTCYQKIIVIKKNYLSPTPSHGYGKSSHEQSGIVSWVISSEWDMPVPVFPWESCVL